MKLTIKELINELKSFHNQNMIVVVQGYESGYDILDRIKIIKIRESSNINTQNKKEDWFFGRYDENSKGEDALLLTSFER
jgi:hypothetical protein